MGKFYNFIEDKEVELIGCEAAGKGVDTALTAATIATGSIGIFHGMKSYFCQDEYGQIAPTSESRIQTIASQAEGFIYVVSSLGVTGVRSEIKTDLGAIVKSIRKVTDVPCAIGFGISTPEQAKAMAAVSSCGEVWK